MDWWVVLGAGLDAPVRGWRAEEPPSPRPPSPRPGPGGVRSVDAGGAECRRLVAAYARALAAADRKIAPLKLLQGAVWRAA